MCEMHSEEYVRHGNYEEIVSVSKWYKVFKGKEIAGKF